MGSNAKYTPRNILITGGAGFIASHVCNRLIHNYPHYAIVVLDKLDYCSSLNNLSPSASSPSFKFINGDICDLDLVTRVISSESIDTVMHFAAQSHVDNSFSAPLDFIHNNTYGTGVLLEACKRSAVSGSDLRSQIRRFIHCSTDEVYGETEDGEGESGKSENSLLRPTNPYSASKAAAEMLVMAAARSDRIPIITTRGNNVYGPHQFPEKLIPKFILFAMEGKPLPIYGDGSNLRSFLYCEDVAEAFDVVLHMGEDGEVYNIGTRDERRVVDVAMDVQRFFPGTEIEFVEDRLYNDRRYLIDDRKVRRLGWSETTRWEEGLRKTVEWYMKNRQGWWPAG